MDDRPAGEAPGAAVDDITYELEIFLTAVIAMAEPVVLEAAVNGRADTLVTFNRRDCGSAPSAFGIEVLLSGGALQRIKP